MRDYCHVYIINNYWYKYAPKYFVSELTRPKSSGIKWLLMNLPSASPVQNHKYRASIAYVSGW